MFTQPTDWRHLPTAGTRQLKSRLSDKTSCWKTKRTPIRTKRDSGGCNRIHCRRLACRLPRVPSAVECAESVISAWVIRSNVPAGGRITVTVPGAQSKRAACHGPQRTFYSCHRSECRQARAGHVYNVIFQQVVRTNQNQIGQSLAQRQDIWCWGAIRQAGPPAH